MKLGRLRVPACLVAVALLLPAAGQFSDRRAPGFSLPDSKFHYHDTQDYRGKVLLIDIMLTTCPVCNRLADTLVQIKKKYGEKVAMISIVTLPDTFAEADKFVAWHGITWPIVFDSGQVIASYMEVTPANPQVHFPHLFVIDGNGAIRNDYEGADDDALTVEGLSAVIDPLLGTATGTGMGTATKP
jgi:peroxiredoxin